MEGNDLYKNGEIDKAIAKYTQAISECKGNSEADQQVRVLRVRWCMHACIPDVHAHAYQTCVRLCVPMC